MPFVSGHSFVHSWHVLTVNFCLLQRSTEVLRVEFNLIYMSGMSKMKYLRDWHKLHKKWICNTQCEICARCLSNCSRDVHLRGDLGDLSLPKKTWKWTIWHFLEVKHRIDVRWFLIPQFSFPLVSCCNCDGPGGLACLVFPTTSSTSMNLIRNLQQLTQDGWIGGRFGYTYASAIRCFSITNNPQKYNTMMKHILSGAFTSLWSFIIWILTAVENAENAQGVVL